MEGLLRSRDKSDLIQRKRLRQSRRGRTEEKEVKESEVTGRTEGGKEGRKEGRKGGSEGERKTLLGVQAVWQQWALTHQLSSSPSVVCFLPPLFSFQGC